MSETRSSTVPQEVAQGQALWVEMRTPEGSVFAGMVDSITVPGAKGSMGVLPRHAPLMSSLDVGLTRLRGVRESPEGKAQDEHRYVTGLGFVEVFENRVLLLVDFADDTRSIDAARAEEARQRAQARLRSTTENVDMARAQAALQRALMRLRYTPKI